MARLGEQHWAAKLEEGTVRELRRLHHDVGLCCKCAARLLGVKYTTAYDAITFRTWAHIYDEATQ